MGRRFTTFDPFAFELAKSVALRGIDCDFIATSPNAILLRRRAGKKAGLVMDHNKDDVDA